MKDTISHSYSIYATIFCLGFIDFIVDPSFQVMGDMLDKILAPLQQQQEQELQDTVSKNPIRKAPSVSSLSSHSSDESSSSESTKNR